MQSSVVGVPTGQAIGPVEVRSVRKLGFNARRVVLYTVLYLVLIGVYAKEHLPVVIAGGYPLNEAVAILFAGFAAISYLLGGFLMSSSQSDGLVSNRYDGVFGGRWHVFPWLYSGLASMGLCSRGGAPCHTIRSRRNGTCD